MQLQKPLKTNELKFKKQAPYTIQMYSTCIIEIYYIEPDSSMILFQLKKFENKIEKVVCFFPAHLQTVRIFWKIYLAG